MYNTVYINVKRISTFLNVFFCVDILPIPYSFKTLAMKGMLGMCPFFDDLNALSTYNYTTPTVLRIGSYVSVIIMPTLHVLYVYSRSLSLITTLYYYLCFLCNKYWCYSLFRILMVY